MKIRSKTKFWQMIGRGTRLCKNLLGIGIDKEKFLIFDFCNNFEFFRMFPKGLESMMPESLTEKIFISKVEIIKELQDLKYQEKEYIKYRNLLIDDIHESIKKLDDENYRVKMNIKFVHKYKNKNLWINLGALDLRDIKVYISPLIIPLNEDELAKRFDNLMYTIQLTLLQNKNVTKPISFVISTAEKLAK
jgi:type I restriction enzyme R subunit